MDKVYPEDISRSIGQLQGLTQGIANDVIVIRDDMKSLRDSFTQLENGRLTKLESRVSYLFGVFAVGGLILPVIVSFLMNRFWK